MTGGGVEKTGGNTGVVFRFLESPGGTALITVVVGAVAAAVLNPAIQDSLKKREFERVAYGQYLSQRRVVTEQVYELVGTSITATERLLSLTKGPFDRDRFFGEERGRRDRQRLELITEYNARQLQWQAEQEVLALRMRYYYPDETTQIGDHWGRIATAVDELMDCAEERLRLYEDRREVVPGACEAKKNSVVSHLEELTPVLNADRERAWRSFEMGGTDSE